MTFQMKKLYIIIVLLFMCIALYGCSYYGTNTILVPENKDKIVCEGAKIVDIWPILIKQKKTAHAYAGIPYFPAFSESKPLELGELHITYEHIHPFYACQTSDLTLVSIDNASIFKPISIWRSKTVEKNGVKYTGCSYKFEAIDHSMDYFIQLRNDHLKNCEDQTVLLKRELKKGYHPILVQ